MIEKILSGSKFSLVFEKQMFRINKLYDKTRHSCIYIAGQIAGPIGQVFLWTLKGGRKVL